MTQSLPQRCFRGLSPLARRLYTEAARPWNRRFSDVEERHWWRHQGQHEPPPPPPQEQQPPSPQPPQPPGDCARVLRRMSVEDIRSSYIYGKLPSLAVPAEQLQLVLQAEADAEAPPPPPATTRMGTVDLLRKEDFLMKLCLALQRSGCPIPRNEYNMQLLLQALGVEGSFSILLSMIFVSFGAPASTNDETHLLRVGGGLDCYKLRKVNHLVNQLLEKKVESLNEAIAKLDAILAEPPLYSWQVMLACYALSSGTVAPLFFKGSLLDGLLSFLVGLVAGALFVISDSSRLIGKVRGWVGASLRPSIARTDPPPSNLPTHPSFPPIHPQQVGLILTAVLSSFLSTILTTTIPGTCSLAVHFGPITYLLPGWSVVGTPACV